MRVKGFNNLYIAGQLSGVEGYVESAASGLYVAFHVLMKLKNKKLTYPRETMLGNLVFYITHANPANFAPMNANFGIYPGATKANRMEIAQNSLLNTKLFKEKLYE
jgi:methylenetetrahydrofolate--tRNA-(uracil-5-)-methyltransferase